MSAMMKSDEIPLSVALNVMLARDSDRATERNDIGFNKPHSWIGHELGAKAPSEWTEIERWMLYDILRWYTRQLAAAGIDYSQLERPESFSTAEIESYKEARSERLAREKRESEIKAKEIEKTAAIKAGRRLDLIVTANRFSIKWDREDSQFPLIKEVVKSSKGYWDSLNYYWHVPAARAYLPLVHRLLDEFAFTISGAAQAKIIELEQDESIQYDGKVTLAGNEARVTFDYDVKFVNAIKTLDKEQRRFDGDKKCWFVKLAAISQLKDLFPTFYFEPALLEIKRVEKPAAPPKPALDLQRLYGERKPFPHQETGIRQMIEQEMVILADDMGLGKTFQALTAAKYWKEAGYKAIVVCPASLRRNWATEAQICGVSIEAYSWAKMPEKIDAPYILICDEAHYAQSIKSSRTKAMLALAKEARAVYLLTGTPLKNGRPANLYPLLLACKHKLAADRRYYERRYCDAKETRWSRWDTTGASNLTELHANTRDIILRRTKKECLNLPEKTRVIREAGFSKEAQALYDGVLNAMRSEYQRRKAMGEIVSDNADAIVMLNHLRQAASLGKCESAIEIADEVIEQGSQVVLFTEFRETARKLELALSRYGVGRITGDVNDEVVEREKQEFQTGKRKVMICTFKRGGVGHTLHAAATVVLVDRPWTPGDAAQAEDRLHRIGQANPVTAIWLQSNEVDITIDALLQAKEERIELVLNGKRKTLRGVGGSVALEALRAICD